MNHDELHFRRLQTEAMLNLAKVRRLADERIAASLHRVELNEITPAQANCLMVLVNNRAPMTNSQLAKEMALSEVTVSRFVVALRKQGWITRKTDRRDRRRSLLVPTKKAKAALPRFIAVSNELLDQAFLSLEPEAVNTFFRVLAAVHNNLRPAENQGE